REIEADPRWHRWLASPDPFTGVPRQQLLNEAISSSSVARVKAFFAGFQAEHGAAGRSQAQSAARTRRSSEKRYYSREDIRDDHRRGAYLGREAEWNRIEADLFAAQREGRCESVPSFLAK